MRDDNVLGERETSHDWRRQKSGLWSTNNGGVCFGPAQEQQELIEQVGGKQHEDAQQQQQHKRVAHTHTNIYLDVWSVEHFAVGA